MKIDKEFEVPARKEYSAAEKADFLAEALDPAKLQLICGRHQYVGSETPPKPRGCRECWQAYWMHKIATTPPHLREQRLAEAEKLLRDAIQLAERGQFDFEPYPHPHVEISKEPN